MNDQQMLNVLYSYLWIFYYLFKNQRRLFINLGHTKVQIAKVPIWVEIMRVILVKLVLNTINNCQQFYNQVL